MIFIQSENISLLDLSSKLLDAIASSEKEKTLEILFSINSVLKNKYNHMKQEYIHLAGPSGSLIRVLECHECSTQCHIEASKALHQLTFSEPEAINEAKIKGSPLYPPEVIATIQRLVISILKEQHTTCPWFSHIEYSHLIISCLSILYNIVVCAPDEVLGSVILNASHSFVFYKLPGVMEVSFSEEQLNLTEQEIREVESDNVTRAYTNRNRRKRLRRKKAQPSRSTLERGFSDSQDSYLNGSLKERAVFMPRTPPPPESLTTLSLKPQWIKTSSEMEGKTSSASDIKELGKGVAALEIKTFSHFGRPISHTYRQKLPSETPSFGKVPYRSLMTEQSPSYLLYQPLELSHNVEHSLNRVSLGFPSQSTEIGEYEAEQISSIEAKVRNCALHTINAVIYRGGRQNKFGFWPQLMCQNHSLMTCILRDPSPAVRMTALQVVNTFLIDSQQVLSMAVDDKGTGSFTSLGRQLGSSIRELHRCLALALLSEKDSSSLVRILKTFELLVQNVHYANLKPGLLTKVVTHVKYFLRYKEAVVRANAFSVMVSFLMVKPQVPEIRDLLTKYRAPAPQKLTRLPLVKAPAFEEEMPGDETDNLETSEESFSSDSCTDEGGEGGTMVSWIIQRCLDSLLLQNRENVQGIYIQVQLQSLKVLSTLVSEHLSLVKDSLSLIQHVIMACCELEVEEGASSLSLCAPDQEADVVVEHSFLLLSSLMGAVKGQLEKSKGQSQSNDADDPLITPELALHLWLWAFQHPLKILLQICNTHEKSAEYLRSNACRRRDVITYQNYPLKPLIAAANVLSHLCSHILQCIGEKMVNQILDVVHFLLLNDELQLKLCGVRVMAIIAAYPPVGESPLGPPLLLSTIDVATKLITNKHINVNKDRLLAAWAIANIFASVGVYRETAKDLGDDKFLTKETILGVLRASISGCRDKDKIKPHAVRCIGHAIASLTPELVSDEEVWNEVEVATRTLTECCSTGSNMRMRWNACHALGNILLGENLPIQKVSYRREILTNLSSLVERFQNYKVRIHACMAICCLDKRDLLGGEFPLVWKAFLRGLEDAQNIPDYHEIQHRDEFINQLCVGLCKLVRVLRVEDLEQITPSLLLHQETVKNMLTKTHRSLPPEHVSCILKAGETLRLLNESKDLTVVQTQGLNALFEVLADFM